jgi:hypothetical protein
MVVWIKEAEAMTIGDPERARLIRLAAKVEWLAHLIEKQKSRTYADAQPTWHA